MFSDSVLQSMKSLAHFCVEDANKLAEWHLRGERAGVQIAQSQVREQFKELNDILNNLQMISLQQNFFNEQTTKADEARRQLEADVDNLEDLKLFEDIGNDLKTNLDGFVLPKRKSHPAAFLKNAMDSVKSAEMRLKRTRDSLQVVSGNTLSTEEHFCPFTKKKFVDPVMNQFCFHNYERQAVEELISSNSERHIRCPYNCKNKRGIELEHLIANERLKKLVNNEGEDDESTEVDTEDTTSQSAVESGL